MNGANPSASASLVGERLLVRDRLTWMVYLQLAIYGYFLYAFAPSVTLLRTDEHTSRAVSGLHGTGLAVGAMLVGVCAPRLVKRLGRGRMLWVGLAIMCVGAVVYTSCTIVAVTIAGALLAGFGGTIVVNLSAAVLTAHHQGAAGGAAVTQANGFGSACGLFAPLLIGAAIAVGIGWRPAVLVCVVFAAVVALIFSRSVHPDQVTAVKLAATPGTGRLSREYWRACGVLVMTTAIEFSMTIWSSDVLRNHDGLSKGVSATGVTAIVGGMTIGRLSSGRLTLRYGTDTLMLWVFGITVVGFGTFWISTIPWLAFVGLFATGLGISLQFPLAITRAIAFSDGRPDLATAYASMGTGFAIAVAPFGLGALADHIGSHTAILAVPVFVLFGALGVATTRHTPVVAGGPTPVAVGTMPTVLD